MDVKIGDVVHVRVRVTYVGGPELSEVEDSDGDRFTVLKSDIVHVEPRPLQVGDKVTWGGRLLNYEIKAIDGDLAWVSDNRTGHHHTMPLAQMERV